MQKVNLTPQRAAQIAAERGLPALATWIAFIVVLTMGRVPAVPLQWGPVLPAAALAAVAAWRPRAWFEYNFGDSEFLLF